MLENCRHSPQVDQPEKVLAAIDDFAARVLAHERVAITDFDEKYIA